ncbi:alpha/beta hydrolase fold domain-containing protein [Microbacterium sp. MYb62]|uniref:alpha/beta hydrolase fold domain-containing protein n=1 Tax=Microbacterium sp. MYb62 TaxID=1848690 RepID=UPI000CFA9DFB|nr:alpha/beta hydrolase fold domain-containing protein [Microbacterium sp. MYb62]PRB16578.1 esterase [Microbacterium sp. MYb62]
MPDSVHADPVPVDPLGAIYAEWTVEFTAAPDMSLPVLRWVFEDWQRATAEPEGVTYASRVVGGVPGILVTPVDADPDQLLLVLHGGGFALGSSASHRKLAGHLAKAAGAHAFVADFRLAPEHPYPAQLDDTDAVLDVLIAEGQAPEGITLVGDSAGASIAIATTLRRLRRGAALPGQVIAVSPWVDMENSGETIETNDATDFLIAREGLQGNIDRYLSGGADPTDPLVNPLYADFRGFPRLYIAASETESLYHDAVRLHALAERAGIDVTFDGVHGEQHVWLLQAGTHAPADAAIARIARWHRAGRSPRVDG